MRNRILSGGEIGQIVLIAALLAVACPMPVLAAGGDPNQGLGGLLDAIMTEQLDSIPNLIAAICFIGGIIFMVRGVLTLKDYATEGKPQHLKGGIAMLIAGSALIALPTFTTWVYNSTMLNYISSGGVQFIPFKSNLSISAGG